MVPLLGMTTLSCSPGSTYCKAVDIIVFARGPRAFSGQQIKNLIYSRWLPGYCRPSYKGGERGWGGGASHFLQQEMIVEATIRWISLCQQQPHGTKNHPLPYFSLSFSLALWLNLLFSIPWHLHHTCFPVKCKSAVFTVCLCSGSHRWLRTRQLQQGKTHSCSTVVRYKFVTAESRGWAACTMCVFI